MARRQPTGAAPTRTIDREKRGTREPDPLFAAAPAPKRRKTGTCRPGGNNAEDRRPLAGDEWPLRRILGSRKGNNGRTEVYADWAPTWITHQSAVSVNRVAVDEWNNRRREGRTLE